MSDREDKKPYSGEISKEYVSKLKYKSRFALSDNIFPPVDEEAVSTERDVNL